MFGSSVGQLGFKLEAVTNRGIREFVRLLPTSKLKELRKIVNCRRWTFRHGCETQTSPVNSEE